MQGSENQLITFLDGMKNRFIIPVYQRKYDWKIENCQQLYEDLKKIIKNKRPSHFFGSIVADVKGNGSKTEYHIIDGQQRVTTITLFLLAIRNLLDKGLVTSKENKLSNQIMERFIIDAYANDDDKIKLHPIENDRLALNKLIEGDEGEYKNDSNLTINYRFFCDQILKEEVTVDEIYHAIEKLQVISITLSKDDNAQLIFESLNSTGLALNEGDKIRNYILMGLNLDEQYNFYNKYWAKIESNTKNNVSNFIRDYLSIKQQSTPTINKVYVEFKKYVETSKIELESLLEDMKKYSIFYGKLLTGKSELKNVKLDDCLYRLNRLEITVAEPFFMEVLCLNQDGKLLVDDVVNIFLITENYLFRRNICEVPTNALNKIFLNLNKEVMRFDSTTNDYVKKFIYVLQSKKESGRFPDDKEFSEALAVKQVYKMRGHYKEYLFERFENYGTIETKDVYTLLNRGTYSIEHIMPQKLSKAWRDELGRNSDEIYTTWIHRLGNLTLTGYNSNLSNSTFKEKRDSEGGYISSGLRMNQKIAKMDSWGVKEMQERSDEMVDYATHTIWTYPETDFIPIEKEFDSCTLDDDAYELTGRKIVKFSYQNVEVPVVNWADMFEHMVKYLHHQDKSVLIGLAYRTSGLTDLDNYFNFDETQLRIPVKIDDSIFAEKNTSTALKISILRKLFAMYGINPMDLVFYLKDPDVKELDSVFQETRMRYWTYAIPVIQEANQGKRFNNVSPKMSNTVAGSFGIGGFAIWCIANKNQAQVILNLGSSSAQKNKKAFDVLFRHKNEIESKLNVKLVWQRADSYKGSWIVYSLDNINLMNDEEWQKIANFHAGWSVKFYNVIVTYLKEQFEIK